jgi:LysM repeat protein
MMQNSNSQRGHFTLGNARIILGRARLSVLAIAAALALSSPVAAQQLIQCPDWKSLVQTSQSYALRKGAPKSSFEQVVLASASSQRDADVQSSGKPRAGSPGYPHPLSALKATSTPPRVACQTYTVQKGDSLSKIAKAQLGDAKRYPELARANGLKVSAHLRVGQQLTMPCAQAIVATAKAAGATTKSSKAVAVKAPAPKPVPLPVWNAKAGEYLTDTITRWGKTAGYKVIKDGVDDWRLSVPVTVEGTFEEALQQLVRGFEGTGRPPGVSIYSNKVVKVGTP